jgi:Ca2+-binding EF-hand superfamily protein
VSKYDKLNEVIEQELLHLFEREIKYQTEVERMKEELQARPDWSLKGAFDAVDLRSDGFLNSDSIKLFLKVNGYTATITELDAIIRRIDTNSDYLITFTEFLDLF